LVQNAIIKKDANVYQPMSKYEDLFIVDRYRELSFVVSFWGGLRGL
jgi:hypothetical protein